MDPASLELVKVIASNLTASFLVAAIIVSFLLDLVVTKRRHDIELSAERERRLSEIALLDQKCKDREDTIVRLLGERNQALAQLQVDIQKVYTFAEAIADLRESVKELTGAINRRRSS